MFDRPITIITGHNGSGKTSLLEALYYLCFLRSFRTHTARDVVSFGHDTFFIKIDLLDAHGAQHTIQVGCQGTKKVVRINDKAVTSFRDILGCYHAIALSEDDLAIIKGGPEERRSFVDHALSMSNEDYRASLKSYRKVLHNRNALLSGATTPHQELLDVWTKELWNNYVNVAAQRVVFLQQIATQMNTLSSHFLGNSLLFHLEYTPKLAPAPYEDTKRALKRLEKSEVRFQRTMFGAHLDDITITHNDHRSRTFSSRGQQKLLVLLLKMAHICLLSNDHIQGIMLLDDFMTDFDEDVVQKALEMAQSIGWQMILTSPAKLHFAQKLLSEGGAQQIELTHRK